SPPLTTASYTLSLHDALPISGPNRLHHQFLAFDQVRPDRLLLAVRLADHRGATDPGEIAALLPEDLHADQVARAEPARCRADVGDWKSTRLNSSHVKISYAVF